MPDTVSPARRPIASRNQPWAIRLSARLARAGVEPNTISAVSMVFALVGGGLTLLPNPLAWLVAAACVQARLVCNLLDGMVAVEGGRKTAVGPLYNEFPDRVADSLLLVPLGYAALQPWLGWLCALLAALTAYVRVFGGSVGLPQSFAGVMAKQRRMAVLTAALVAGAVELWLSGTRWVPLLGGIVIALGSLVTCWTRTRAIAAGLRAL